MITPPQDSNKFSSCTFRNFFIAPSQKKTFLFITVLLVLFYTCTGKGKKDFDFLIFTQRWIPSSCIEYEEKPGSGKTCDLPDNYDFWAIHGLWPTKGGTMGPFFCNKSMKFDESALEPIKPVLEKWWPNIENGKTVSSLWEHEWTKHGTCAAQLEALDKEFKYFNTTLGFFKEYNINDLFNENHIESSDINGYNVLDLFLIVKNKFGKNPHINCVMEQNSKRPLLAEIRICFDKKLNLMDCEEVNAFYRYFNRNLSTTVTNCPLETHVLIPKTIGPFAPQLKQKRTYDILMEILNLIKFFQWVFI